MKIFKKSAGFTLFETLLYLALFALLMSGLVASVYYIIQGVGHNRSAVVLQEEANFLLEKFDWALIDARSMTVSPKSLTVEKYYFGLTPLVFDIANDTVRLSQRGSTSLPLLSSRVVAKDLHFVEIPASAATTQGVTISFALQIRDESGKTLERAFSSEHYLK